MPRLLVSVRSAEEARDALAGGADLIDVKEPSRGSLGAASRSTIEAVFNAVGRSAEVSVACGEWTDWSPSSEPLPVGISFAKIGLAGAASRLDWKTVWTAWRNWLPRKASAVAVAYADDRFAASPDWHSVWQWAHRQRCGAMLLDTHSKGNGWLMDHLGYDAAREFVAKCRESGLLSVLAGSIEGEKLSVILDLDPDIVAVRGAVCHGDRRTGLCRDRVAQLARRLAPVTIEKPPSFS